MSKLDMIAGRLEKEVEDIETRHAKEMATATEVSHKAGLKCEQLRVEWEANPKQIKAPYIASLYASEREHLARGYVFSKQHDDKVRVELLRRIVKELREA